MAEVSGRRVTATGVASGDLNFADPANYRFLVKTGKDVHLAASSGAMAYGVLQNKPKDNEHATVVVDGFTKVVLGSSLGADCLVMTNNTGFAVLLSSGGATLGRLITGADSGKVGEMFFTFASSGR